MKTIEDILKSRKKQTNCFNFYTEVLEWVKNKEATLYIINDNLYVFYKTNGNYKFYYYVDTLADIKDALVLLNKYKIKSNVSLSFTTKNEKGIKNFKEITELLGFEFYKEYARVISGPSAYKSKENKEYYTLATQDNKKELLEIIYKEFDVITDYLPSEKELLELIENKSILINKIDEKIIFIQIYEYKKGTLYSRMTWVDKKYRKPKYTIDLYAGLDAYIKDLNIKSSKNLRSYGWIDKANKNYKINIKFGAQPDGITSSIFLFKGKKNEN